mmetsp:Transcript_22124/g.77526  ORF Transcript_22124/g.77526 Transcript_22124/m.77526 type:complete len:301 (-) Transcript_22124:3959-4861(-)
MCGGRVRRCALRRRGRTRLLRLHGVRLPRGGGATSVCRDVRRHVCGRGAADFLGFADARGRSRGRVRGDHDYRRDARYRCRRAGVVRRPRSVGWQGRTGPRRACRVNHLRGCLCCSAHSVGVGRRHCCAADAAVAACRLRVHCAGHAAGRRDARGYRRHQAVDILPHWRACRSHLCHSAGGRVGVEAARATPASRNAARGGQHPGRRRRRAGGRAVHARRLHRRWVAWQRSCCAGSDQQCQRRRIGVCCRRVLRGWQLRCVRWQLRDVQGRHRSRLQVVCRWRLPACWRGGHDWILPAVR